MAGWEKASKFTTSTTIPESERSYLRGGGTPSKESPERGGYGIPRGTSGQDLTPGTPRTPQRSFGPGDISRSYTDPLSYLGHFASDDVAAAGHNTVKGGKVEKVMHEFKTGTLHSGSKKGPKVGSRKQAIAIALSEARKAGENVKRKK